MLHFCSYNRFTWDEIKNRGNGLFLDPHSLSYPGRIVDEEKRWHTIEDTHAEEEIRIISARKANPRERSVYHTAN